MLTFLRVWINKNYHIPNNLQGCLEKKDGIDG